MVGVTNWFSRKPEIPTVPPGRKFKNGTQVRLPDERLGTVINYDTTKDEYLIKVQGVKCSLPSSQVKLYFYERPGRSGGTRLSDYYDDDRSSSRESQSHRGSGRFRW